jgi:uncharacterized membrane protein (DUF2068 family)
MESIRPDPVAPADGRAAEASIDALKPRASKRRALRGIAVFELTKALIALGAALGLFSLLHHDLHHLASALISHVGLDPGGRYPTLLLHDLDVLKDTKLRTLLAAAGAYATVRLVEAWGLWHGRSWGEWLGALSGAIYLPFEWRHLLHQPSVTNVAVLLVNLAVVLFLGWQLWRERRAAVELP